MSSLYKTEIPDSKTLNSILRFGSYDKNFKKSSSIFNPISPLELVVLMNAVYA
jgi:hypothetical protein